MIFWLVFSKITYVPLAILIAYFITQFIIILVFFLFVVLFLYLTTFRIWRDHLNRRFGEANRFLKIVESKTEILITTFQELFKTQFPKDVYWIDFKIDPFSFEIKTIIHSIEPNSTTDITDVETALTAILKVDKSTMTDYKKVGWEADENIELSLELIQRWFTEIWLQEVSDEFKIRSTFSVKDRDGHYNFKNGDWEDTNIFLGNPLQ